MIPRIRNMRDVKVSCHLHSCMHPPTQSGESLLAPQQSGPVPAHQPHALRASQTHQTSQLHDSSSAISSNTKLPLHGTAALVHISRYYDAASSPPSLSPLTPFHHPRQIPERGKRERATTVPNALQIRPKKKKKERKRTTDANRRHTPRRQNNDSKPWPSHRRPRRSSSPSASMPSSTPTRHRSCPRCC